MRSPSSSNLGTTPFRIAIAGLTHGHVKTFHRVPREGIVLAGVAEPRQDLLDTFGSEHGIDRATLFADLGQMLDAVRPEGVAAFGSIFDHLAVVEAAAPRGIHVMVEKPLAVSVEHARAMAALARRYGIHLLTNYETSWYPSTHRAIALSQGEGDIGRIRKMVVHDGHRGPQEIGCAPEFLAWLGNPALGGGAMIDFGCYGANLMTRLMGGEPPLSVTAVTRQFKPALYPQADDDATILLNYAGAEGVVQASWNWAVSRKDIEIYGEAGYVIASDGSTLRSRNGDTDAEHVGRVPALPSPLDEPFAHFAAVVRGMTVLARDDLAELDNNLTVVRILEAARLSAATGRTVRWTEITAAG